MKKCILSHDFSFFMYLHASNTASQRSHWFPYWYQNWQSWFNLYPDMSDKLLLCLYCIYCILISVIGIHWLNGRPISKQYMTLSGPYGAYLISIGWVLAPLLSRSGMHGGSYARLGIHSEHSQHYQHFPLYELRASPEGPWSALLVKPFCNSKLKSVQPIRELKW